MAERRLTRIIVGLLAAVVMTNPTYAWDVNKASTNLSVPALSSSELIQRKILLVSMGMLEVPTGAIVTADPLVTPERDPLERKLIPGRYPVVLFQAHGRNALAMLRVAPGNPVNWELATIPGQDVSTLKDDEIFGYPVDAGTGSFFDKSAWPLMEERQRREEAKNPEFSSYYDDVLAKDYPGEKDGESVMHRPLPESPVNIAVFSSGWGDGFYASFWGLDASGKPLMLLTDFGVLENGDARTPYELQNAATIGAMTLQQNADIAAALTAIRTDDLMMLEKLLTDRKVTPESYVAETGFTLTLDAIRHSKPKALELLIRHGAPKEIPVGMLMEIATYPDYARRIAASSNPNAPAIVALLDVVKRWEAGEIKPTR